MKNPVHSIYITFLGCLMLIAVGIPRKLHAQKYELRLMDTDSTISGDDAWGVYDVQDTHAARLIGQFPNFFATYGFIHEPVLVGDQVFFGFVSHAWLKNHKAWDTMVWGVYRVEKDTVRLLEQVVKRIRYPESICALVLEDEMGFLIYERGPTLDCMVRFGLKAYKVGTFDKLYAYFRHQFRNYKKLEESPFPLHLDQI